MRCRHTTHLFWSSACPVGGHLRGCAGENRIGDGSTRACCGELTDRYTLWGYTVRPWKSADWSFRTERQSRMSPQRFFRMPYEKFISVRCHRYHHDPIRENIQRIRTDRPALQRFASPGSANNHLYQSDYTHRQDGVSCEEGGCDPKQRIHRPIEAGHDSLTVVHRGTIASGELVLKDARLKDALACMRLDFRMQRFCLRTVQMSITEVFTMYFPLPSFNAMISVIS